MDVKPIWFDYLEFDEDGDVTGIRDDAPEDVKKSYAEHVNQERQYMENGELIPR